MIKDFIFDGEGRIIVPVLSTEPIVESVGEGEKE